MECRKKLIHILLVFGILNITKSLELLFSIVQLSLHYFFLSMLLKTNLLSEKKWLRGGGGGERGGRREKREKT